MVPRASSPWPRARPGSRGRAPRAWPGSRFAAAPRAARARRGGASPMPARLSKPSLLEHYEGVTLRDRLAFLAADLLDRAGVLCLYGHLHLHRLEDDERVALVDRLADLTLDLPDRSSDVRFHVGHGLA